MPENSSKHNGRYHAHPVTKALAIVGVGTAVFHAIRFGVGVFGPSRSIKLEQNADTNPESAEYLYRLGCLTDALTHKHSVISVLRNGPEFYPAEFDAIDSATRTINLEVFEFFKGDVTQQVMQRLVRKIREGVQVRVIIDSMGSFGVGPAYLKPLTDAGAQVQFYHPINSRDWLYFNHRTHRKLLVIDGRVGFIGGAGFADHWIEIKDGKLPWRDTVLKVEGSVAGSLNATFAQSWAETCGELLFSDTQFPSPHEPGESPCMVIMSSPSHDMTRARMLFQTLVDSATESIQITSPYFLPDHSARRSLARAVRERNVKVRVLTAGSKTDHVSVLRLSEATSVNLIRAGVEFYEYQASMLHAKLMVVDHQWTVAGSTNFDQRSFQLNNEVNIAIRDKRIASQLSDHFEDDLKQSRRLTIDGIRHESPTGRLIAAASWLVRREE